MYAYAFSVAQTLLLTLERVKIKHGGLLSDGPVISASEEQRHRAVGKGDTT